MYLLDTDNVSNLAKCTPSTAMVGKLDSMPREAAR